MVKSYISFLLLSSCVGCSYLYDPGIQPLRFHALLFPELVDAALHRMAVLDQPASLFPRSLQSSLHIPLLKMSQYPGGCLA